MVSTFAMSASAFGLAGRRSDSLIVSVLHDIAAGDVLSRPRGLEARRASFIKSSSLCLGLHGGPRPFKHTRLVARELSLSATVTGSNVGKYGGHDSPPVVIPST
jgi:hypothetical protein